jgi:predicted transcriptional regulator
MAKRAARDKASVEPARTSRKVTYSLPDAVARELDRRASGSPRGKSRLVAEALAFYFAAQDRRALSVLYAEAAEDPQFMRDNEAVQRDFAALDRELDEPSR